MTHAPEEWELEVARWSWRKDMSAPGRTPEYRINMSDASRRPAPLCHFTPRGRAASNREFEPVDPLAQIADHGSHLIGVRPPVHRRFDFLDDLRAVPLQPGDGVLGRNRGGAGGRRGRGLPQ